MKKPLFIILFLTSFLIAIQSFISLNKHLTFKDIDSSNNNYLES
jgi:hypothetical protein